MSISPYSFSETDREQFHYWIGRIPSGGPEEALFNALALKLRHDVAGLHMVTQGLIDLSDRSDRRTAALLELVESQAKHLTTLAAEMAEITASLKTAVSRLDQGMTMVESLHEQDIRMLTESIGAPDPNDPRTVRQHLRDQDVDRAKMRRDIQGLAWVCAVLVLLTLARFWMLTADHVSAAVGRLW